MTDPDPLDELASAHLDGATTPEEAERVAADPELQARVEALRAVRVALTAMPLVDAQRREHAIAAALAAFDEADATGGGVAPVRSLTPVAGRRRGPSAQAWRAIGAAAAVAVLAALVPLLASLSSSSDDSADTASRALEERGEDGAADAPMSAAAPESAVGGEVSTTLANPLASQYAAFGSFPDDDALVQAIRDDLVRAETMTVADDALDATSCLDELLAGLPAGASPVLTAMATVAGTPVAAVATSTEVRIAGADCTDVRILAR
jgi:hypothetical protein